MNEPIDVSEFQATDTVACQVVASRAAWSSYASFLPQIEDYFAETTPLQDVEQRWVVQQASQIIGFVEIDGNHIRNLFVDPSYQGRGVGTTLIRKVEDVVVGDITLNCFTVNPNARRLYERVGFVVEHEGCSVLGGVPIPVWKMRKVRSR